MHKYLLYPSLALAFGLSLGGAFFVNAQSVSPIPGFHQGIDPRTSVNRYLTTTGTYAGAHIDPLTGKGTLSLSRTDDKRGVILTDFSVTPKTLFLRKYGSPASFNDFKINEDVSVYGQRNADGTMTAVSATDNNLWLLDPAIQRGVIMSVDTEKNTLTVTETASGQQFAFTYAPDTKFLLPKALPGKETDLVVGKNIRVRGVVRKIGTSVTVEQTFVIWVLPDDHNDN